MDEKLKALKKENARLKIRLIDQGDKLEIVEKCVKEIKDRINLNISHNISQTRMIKSAMLTKKCREELAMLRDLADIIKFYEDKISNAL